jgi:hypothetical protein
MALPYTSLTNGSAVGTSMTTAVAAAAPRGSRSPRRSHRRPLAGPRAAASGRRFGLLARGALGALAVGARGRRSRSAPRAAPGSGLLRTCVMAQLARRYPPFALPALPGLRGDARSLVLLLARGAVGALAVGARSRRLEQRPAACQLAAAKCGWRSGASPGEDSLTTNEVESSGGTRSSAQARAGARSVARQAQKAPPSLEGGGDGGADHKAALWRTGRAAAARRARARRCCC